MDGKPIDKKKNKRKASPAHAPGDAFFCIPFSEYQRQTADKYRRDQGDCCLKESEDFQRFHKDHGRLRL